LVNSWVRGSFFLLTVALGMAACGEPAPPDGSGGADTGGSESGGSATGGSENSGGSESGGASSGGSSSGGEAGSEDGGSSGDGGDLGTGGTIPEDMHCSPGDTYGAIAYAGLLSNCGTIGGEVGEDQDYGRSINLDAPIGPGDTYAFSVDMQSSFAEKMEFWGATEECGDGLELLATAVMGEGIRCVEFKPQEGTYTHVSWVWFSGGAHGDATFCPEGTCGE
jgi:hypothetical protein